MNYELKNQSLTVTYDPEALTLTAAPVGCGEIWVWNAVPTLRLADGTVLSFADAVCESNPYKTGIADGVRAVYSGFRAADGTVYPFTVSTFVFLDIATGDLRTEATLSGDTRCQLSAMVYPPRMKYDAKEGEGYTVLPRMQGTLVPAGHPIKIVDGIIFERDAYIPIFGQTKNGSGYLAIYETPYDARYELAGEEVQPYFIPSLGFMGEKRAMRYTFYAKDCDFNVIAKGYRSYLSERGQLVTLKEKIARNPKVAELIGTPVIHSGIAVHISPKSDFFRPDDPGFNDNYTTFDERAEQLAVLKKNGVEKAYLHLDGWGNHGYDNLHPDVFPPHEAAGGYDGMKRLGDACKELGYLYGIHDQYRDYYYDAESFSLDNALEYGDGSHPYCSVWYGGPHSWMCATLAPDYVRRNYNTLAEHGIELDGSYLDVFSVVLLDECFNPDHPMTRKQCAEKRRECLDILTSRGIIPSSEEVVGCIINSQVLCHHTPFYTTGWDDPHSKAIGISIPLLNLVYHDCIIIPWFGLNGKGGWGLPGDDWGFLWALLCGGTIYYNIEESPERIAFGKIALELHKRIALCELVSHELITEHRRRSTFSDGTVVEADFDACTFAIHYPEGKIVSGSLDA